MHPTTAPPLTAASDAPAEPNVLIVDDRAANLVALEAVLAPLGHRLVRARSGEEALRCMIRESFAVVLIDVHMPGLDGFETAALIKSLASCRHVPIIFLTAVSADPSQIFRGYERGAVDYMLKPFEPQILRSKVSVFVELHRRDQEIRRLNRDLSRLVEERTRELERANVELRVRLDQLRESQAQLIESSKMAAVGTLVAGLSHELNNPLSIILAGAQNVLRRTPNDAPTRPTLAAIAQAAERCGGILHRLLELAGSAAVPSSLRVRVDARELVRRVVTLAAARAEERGVSLATAPSSDDPGALEASASELQSALLHLVHNAIDASANGGAVVLGVARRARDGRDGVEFTVVDDGHGIEPELLPRIFDPFFTTRPAGEGVGLGLPVARRIVEAHGGHLRVESLPGSGSTLRVWLPPRSERPSRRPSAA